jgi:hypothetical protein
MVTTKMSIAAGMILLFGGCGGSDDDPIESKTERLSPPSTRCVTTDDCLYGHCSTEDGVCYGAASCTAAATCSGICFGTCEPSPPPESAIRR